MQQYPTWQQYDAMQQCQPICSDKPLIPTRLIFCCHFCSRTTGLKYTATKGLKAPRNITRPGYRSARLQAEKVRNLGATGAVVTDKELSLAACGSDNVEDPKCLDIVLQALTPAAYSSNNSADTPGGRAFISPAQDQGGCSACVGFSVTAAAEAAINLHLQQEWRNLS
jgi:hypothetical protein